MFSVTLRFGSNVQNEEKTDLVNKLINSLDFLELNHLYSTQAVLSFRETEDISTKMQSLSLLGNLTDIFGDDPKIVSISIGPFDLEQSFSENQR